MQKIIRLCKFIINLILPEEDFVFEMRPEFFCKKIPAALHPPAHTCVSYQNPEVKHLIHLFKYNKNTTALNICAEFLSEKIISVSKQHDLTKYTLIPIPRSKDRIKKYGFDQCDLLCREILKNKEIKKLRLVYKPKILIHKKNIESQTKSTRIERITNSKNTFFINQEKISIENKIILIDDVITTGATLSDAVRALKDYGTTEIFCFTIAH